MNNRIGVYICHCGSNISDYVDVEKVKGAIENDDGVVIAKTMMFACADSSQKEIIEDIKTHDLDAMVVASCSPKLHLFTFRNVAERAGLNPYNYVQANIREQVSWAHSDNPKGATLKAIQVVKSAISRVRYSEALTNPVIPAENSVLVIGAGVAGLRAAIELTDMGSHVYVIEREHFIGGRTSQWNTLFTTNETGQDLITRLYRELKDRDNITLFTGADIISCSGSVGNFEAEIRIRPRFIDTTCKKDNEEEFEQQLLKAIDACPVEVPDEFNFGITKRKAIFKNFKSEFPECPVIDIENCTRCGACEKEFKGVALHQKEESLTLNVGAILLASGFDPYEPEPGEFGYGQSDHVITLQQFKRLIELSPDKLVHKGKTIRHIAYIYCVGSRQVNGDKKHCSRYCCTSAIHTATLARTKYQGIYNYHFYKDIRTYGKLEILYNDALSQGDIFIEFHEDSPPEVTVHNNGIIVSANDMLTNQVALNAKADLVVLVTGMGPRKNNSVADILKIPIGRDSFFNEVHPKLKPVETVIEGIYISGACQAPFNVTEAVRSSLTAAAKANALLRKGEIVLEPTKAIIHSNLCIGSGECIETCPYSALEMADINGKKQAVVNESKCKGCGMCLPVCPANAIELIGYSDQEVETMIEALAD